MLNKLKTSITLLALALAASGSSATPIANGQFETGSFLGWTLIHYSYNGAPSFAAVVDNRAGGPVIQGDYSALLVAQGSSCAPEAQDPWAVGCPGGTPIPFPNAPAQGPTLANPFPSWDAIRDSGLTVTRFGPVIGQDVASVAGGRLTIDYRFFTNDDLAPAEFGDDVGFFLVRGDHLIGANGWSNDGCSGGGPGRGVVTGFRSNSQNGCVDLTIPTAGIWTLYITVGNSIEDTLLSSGVMIDSVDLRVPEPAVPSLLLFAGLSLVWSRRRRH